MGEIGLEEKIKIAISETIGNADVDVTGSESKYTVKVYYNLGSKPFFHFSK